ncbi:MAG: hypothetical protein ACPGSD_04420 [Flavobacteriales bacterium]
MNKIFSNPQFWKTYERLFLEGEEKRFNSEDVLAELKKDFEIEVRKHTYISNAEEQQIIDISKAIGNQLPYSEDENYSTKFYQLYDDLKLSDTFSISKYKDKTIVSELTFVQLKFPLPLDAVLILELEIDKKPHAIPEQSLFLMHQNEKHQLGFWDSAHWLPFCFQLQELETLCNYWDNSKSNWQNQGDLAFTLLAKFIGISSNAEQNYIVEKYQNLLAKRGLTTEETFPSHTECKWIKTEKGEEFVSVSLPKHLKHLDVKGIETRALSYSLRKQNYCNIENFEEFPFELWNEVMKTLTTN